MLPRAIPEYIDLSLLQAFASGISSNTHTIVIIPPTNDSMYSINVSDSIGPANMSDKAAPRGSVSPESVAIPIAAVRDRVLAKIGADMMIPSGML